MILKSDSAQDGRDAINYPAGFTNAVRLPNAKVGCAELVRKELELMQAIITRRVGFILSRGLELGHSERDRRRFPVWLAFAVTINKSLGPSFHHVGVCLADADPEPDPVFGHGVALGPRREIDPVSRSLLTTIPIPVPIPIPIQIVNALFQGAPKMRHQRADIGTHCHLTTVSRNLMYVCVEACS